MTVRTFKAGHCLIALKEPQSGPLLPLSVNDVYVYVLKDLFRDSVAASHVLMALEGPSWWLVIPWEAGYEPGRSGCPSAWQRQAGSMFVSFPET